MTKKNLKSKIVEELSNLIKTKNTILLASIKNLPTAQFQEIKKNLREKVIIKVPKKNLILRAINNSENEELKKIKNEIKGDTAIIFSDLDAFELAYELVENKKEAKAKAGQIAEEDIEILPGPTDLVPGPAISELGALGVKIQIENGKINIKEPKIIVKKGEKISQSAADIMNKLNIKPFLVGIIPFAAFDKKTEKLYLNIKINKKENLENIKTSFIKSLAFAININYICHETISFLIRKAAIHGKALEKIQLNK